MLVRTAHWAISHRPNLPLATLQDRNGAERCAPPWAPRPAPLLHQALWVQMTLGLSSSLDEPRGSDQPSYTVRHLSREGFQFAVELVKQVYMVASRSLSPIWLSTSGTNCSRGSLIIQRE